MHPERSAIWHRCYGWAVGENISGDVADCWLVGKMALLSPSITDTRRVKFFHSLLIARISHVILFQPKRTFRGMDVIPAVARLSWWLSGKESTSQCRRCRSDLWVGKVPWRRKWNPIPVFLFGKSQGQEEPGGLQSMGLQKSWTQLSD